VPKQLTTHNASITTAAVEVKALTLSGKQVTLSVFRQLREEPLLAEDATLNGVPWGYVNYHPDRCGDDGRPHWHIVWQRGQELLRSRVDHSHPNTEWGCKEGDAFLTAHAREVFEHRGQYFNGRMPVVNSDMVAVVRKEAPFPVGMIFDQSLISAYFAWEEWRTVADKHAKAPNSGTSLFEPRYRRKLADAVEALSCAAPEPGEVAELYATYRGRLDDEISRRQRHHQVRAALAELPQLFIAV
jgi:hypothetical protein